MVTIHEKGKKNPRGAAPRTPHMRGCAPHPPPLMDTPPWTHIPVAWSPPCRDRGVIPAYPAINRLGLFAASRPKGSSARKIVCIYPHITPQTNVTVHILRPKNPDITPDRIALPGDPLNRGKHRDIMRSCNV